MPEEIQTTVKVPISEIVASLRKKHELPSKLVEVRLEGNKIVLNFAETGEESLDLKKNDEPLKTRAYASEPVKKEAIFEVMKNNEPLKARAYASEPVEKKTTYEEEMEIPETMDDESMETEEDRERRRFGRK
jgi:hypothetical protein